MTWIAGGYAPTDGTPILVLDRDGGGAQTVSFRSINGREGWYSPDGDLLADTSDDDFAIFAAGWTELPPHQEKLVRQKITEAS